MERAYRDKLIAFNSTAKYQEELIFLHGLLEPKIGEKILDFGCGIGTAVNYISGSGAEVLGHDQVQYMNPMPNWFRGSIYFDFDKVYFMHSFAHIQKPDYVMGGLNRFLKESGRVVVITPNRSFIENTLNEKYVKDPTVVEHYSLKDLTDLFVRHNFKVISSGSFGEVSSQGNHNERIFLVAEKCKE